MKECFIGLDCILCVGFKCGPMNIKIYLGIGLQIIDLKRRIWYDQEEKMKMEFLCGTQVSHALAYVLSNEWSRYYDRARRDTRLPRVRVKIDVGSKIIILYYLDLSFWCYIIQFHASDGTNIKDNIISFSDMIQNQAITLFEKTCFHVKFPILLFSWPQ
jgi:hypothetical protein